MRIGDIYGQVIRVQKGYAGTCEMAFGVTQCIWVVTAHLCSGVGASQIVICFWLGTLILETLLYWRTPLSSEGRLVYSGVTPII